MSSTRHVGEGERRQQHGWASAPEFDDLRGLNGTAVALKAALFDDPKEKELLYFLQALSLREGGLKRIASEVIEMFPERIGTPTMHKAGYKPGKTLLREQRAKIERELNPEIAERERRRALLHEQADHARRLMRMRDPANGIEVDLRIAANRITPPPEPHSADELHAECKLQAAGFGDFLERLCCDPVMDVLSSDLLIYFRDVRGALFEFKSRHEDQARARFVQTSIGKVVFEALDYVQETGKSALIEGDSGFGKSTAIRAWHEINLGRSRYVELKGITTRTSFFRSLASALGVANGGGMSSGKIQWRVEEFLKRTKLLLIIDEGQYLWPQGKRIESHPELVNWLNTACWNEGVPFVISATDQYTKRRQHIEAQTDWQSFQSRRRTTRVFRLPLKPTDTDLEKVARARLSAIGLATNTAVDRVVGYAKSCQGFFQSITDAIDDACLIAKRAGRAVVTYKDLKTAIDDWRAESDAALQRVFNSSTPSKPKRHRHHPPAPESNFASSDQETASEDLTEFRFIEATGATRTIRSELATAGSG